MRVSQICPSLLNLALFPRSIEEYMHPFLTKFLRDAAKKGVERVELHEYASTEYEAKRFERKFEMLDLYAFVPHFPMPDSDSNLDLG